MLTGLQFGGLAEILTAQTDPSGTAREPTGGSNLKAESVLLEWEEIWEA